VGIDVDQICELAVEAGQAIVQIYESTFEVEYKEDHSPLTEADLASHKIIARGLHDLDPEIPVLSEEGKQISFEERTEWKSFWLVDPLDGTKEFIKRNGEFTVNIALIQGHRPVLGVIYVPAQDLLYYATQERGTWKREGQARPVSIRVREASNGEGLVVVQSRSHGSEKLQQYLEKMNVKESMARGSALKFCSVAEGLADIYPRFGPTWEWDTAAGDCIVNAAGGQVVDLNRRPLQYNKPVIKHDHFIAVSDLCILSLVEEAR
jgi:3'(2'), 5'-bisphosphate nucleotidase